MSTQFVTREKLAECLTANGFPITLSYLNLICAPSSRVAGPPVAYYWGPRRRPIYDLQQALACARSRTVAGDQQSKALEATG
jgi:hypothetical protein